MLPEKNASFNYKRFVSFNVNEKRILTEKEFEFLCANFGLFETPYCSVTEKSNYYHFTYECGRQILKKAINKVKQAIELYNLKVDVNNSQDIDSEILTLIGMLDREIKMQHDVTDLLNKINNKFIERNNL